MWQINIPASAKPLKASKISILEDALLAMWVWILADEALID